MPYGFTLNGVMRTKSGIKEYGMQSEEKKVINARGMVAPVLAMAPVFSIFIKLLNTAADASKRNFTSMLEKRMRIGVTPGGIDEMNC